MFVRGTTPRARCLRVPGVSLLAAKFLHLATGCSCERIREDLMSIVDATHEKRHQAKSLTCTRTSCSDTMSAKDEESAGDKNSTLPAGEDALEHDTNRRKATLSAVFVGHDPEWSASNSSSTSSRYETRRTGSEIPDINTKSRTDLRRLV